MSRTAIAQCGAIGLRLCEPETDLSLLWEWRNNLDEVALWCPRRHPVSRQEFQREWEALESSSTHIRMMITRHDRVVGSIFSYNYNPLHGWVYVTTYTVRSARGIGVGPVAWGLFVEYLFDLLPLRKVYCEVYGFNPLSLKTMINAGLAVEATIPNHLYWQGQYHELILLALYREDVGRVRQFLQRRRSIASPDSVF
jgi:RimJ/RimL family protein N-acetyltransferase